MATKETFSNIEIEKDTISYKNAIIQICNISKISLESMEKMKMPFGVMAVAALGSIIFYEFGQQMAAVLSFLVCLFPALYVVCRNDDLGVFLVITLNSGDKIFFECQDKSFLESAFERIAESIKGGKIMSVNFSNCTINSAGKDIHYGDIVGRDKVQGDKVQGDKVQGDKTYGNKKVVDIGNVTATGQGNSAIRGIGNEIVSNDWKRAEETFEKLLNDYRIDTEQYEFCELAKQYCANKNSDRLKGLIERRKSVFDNIVRGFASSTAAKIFIHLIEKLTGLSL